MKEFVNGKVVKISEGKLNPKFQPMAGKVSIFDLIAVEFGVYQITSANAKLSPIFWSGQWPFSDYFYSKFRKCEQKEM